MTRIAAEVVGAGLQLGLEVCGYQAEPLRVYAPPIRLVDGVDDFVEVEGGSIGTMNVHRDVDAHGHRVRTRIGARPDDGISGIGVVYEADHDVVAAIAYHENGLGTIAPNSLEMSNVDISEEFVAMITNQRGFQANSKIITTVDQMLQETIQMKR